ncbi:MAG: hypothetical protein ACRDCE_17950 [Cetobacterium sp.]|uniref:hypothetical protein n=1 Tax=Cetobacterium sp. TaxID=2071632 RepID=UPI003EE8117E
MKLFEVINKANPEHRFFLDITCIESISILPIMNEGDAPVAKVRTKSGDKLNIDANTLMMAISTPSSNLMTIQPQGGE